MIGQAYKKLKIGIIAPPWFPVPPAGYGGIEAVVSLLTEGLCKRGHEVTLFASGDSSTCAKLVSVFDKAPNHKIADNIYLENIHSLNAYAQSKEFDIIHDHDGMGSRLLGSLVSRLFDIPVLATMHGPADKGSINFYSSVADGLFFIAISDYQRKSYVGIDFLTTIPNAIKVEDYPFSESHNDYLLFVGRMNEEKGAHIAVQVANSAKKKLIIVGKCSEPQEKIYFENKVRPLMTDYIEYLGEVNFNKKIDLYKNAECVLFPIQWPEPFGLVMIEAMACGTPVIAIKNGSVPEVIKDGITGFIVESESEMLEAIEKISSIDRHACRQHVIENFSEEIFIKRHEQAYFEAIDRKRVRSHQL